MGLKVLIVGGVAGGATAAARLRRMNEDARIIVFEKGEYISFANCGLPYYIGEVIKEKKKLVVTTPEMMKTRFNIDVRIKSEVVKINSDKKTVEVKDYEKNETYFESYDKLVLSPGAEPIKPPLPGLNSKKVFTLRNIPDTYRIKDYVDREKPKRAVIVGAGFIGLEVAENLHNMGVKVTVVELADHVIGPLDYEMASIVHQHLKIKGVEFYLNNALKSCKEDKSCIVAELSNKKLLKTDMVILGIGVKPETSLAKDAGLKTGKTGGILVDSRMATSDPDIYAVGDAVEIKDFVSGYPALIPLAGPANKQGRIAANNICGLNEEFKGTQGTSIVKVFDLTIAITGNNEKLLKKREIEYEKVFTHSPSHAGYYPGAVPMAVKLMFSKEDGKILGAQIIGYDGVDKRIDVLATALRAGMTVYDLEELELAYAPPYSSAKDPVNIAGYVASNVLKGEHNIFHWHDIENLDKSNSVLVDVRTPSEFAAGTIDSAVNIQVDDLRDRLDEIDREKKVYIFCQVGLRGYIAYRILKQHGFKNVLNLSGGYKTYSLAVQKQSNEDIYEYDKILINDDFKSMNCEAEGCDEDITMELDACGLQCPGPIIKVFDTVKKMNYGEIVKIMATDPAFGEDIKSWCEKTGNKLLKVKQENETIFAYVKKNRQEEVIEMGKGKNDKTMVIFSNDLDKTIASFIIANGAAAMGRKVTMFFTFWGLNILRKSEKVKTSKNMIEKMFAIMMPRGSGKLKLSKMHMLGMGGKMIRGIMKKKNVESLEQLIKQAKDHGVRLVACNMSMDIMGIKREELMDEVEIGGVASFLGSAEESDMSLFI